MTFTVAPVIALDYDLTTENISVEAADAKNGRVLTSELCPDETYTAEWANGSINSFRSATAGFHVELRTVQNYDDDPTTEAVLVAGAETLTLSRTSLTLAPGSTEKLTATLSNNYPNGNRTVTWESDDPAVATVAADGAVTAIAVGSTTVRAVGDGVKAAATVTVSTPVYIPTGGIGDDSVPVTVDGETTGVKGKLKDGVLTLDKGGMEALLTGIQSAGAVRLDVSGLSGVSSVSIPAAAVGLLESRLIGGTLTLRTASGSLTLDSPAVTAVAKAGSGDMTLGFEQLTPSQLTDLQREALAGRSPVALMRATALNGAEEVHDLGGGTARMAPAVPKADLVNLSHPAGLYLAQTAQVGTDMTLARRHVYPTSEGDGLELLSQTCSEYAIIDLTDAEWAAGCPRDETCPLAEFGDLDLNAWYHDGIHFALDKGWLQGMGDGVFAPDGSTTRAMAVTLIWRMAGQPAPVAGPGPFFDVWADGGQWYTDAVMWAAQNGIVVGYVEGPHTVFAPDRPVTRAQFAAMLYRYAKLNGQGFTGLWSFELEFPDAADVADWADEAMHWMVMRGVINGMDGRLNPQGSSTRAQIAAMVQRFAAIAE